MPVITSDVFTCISNPPSILLMWLQLILRLSHLSTNVCKWIHSFLTAGVKFTCINNVRLSQLIPYTGTPQGIALSPILFSVYTDFVHSHFSNTVIIKYADGTVILGLISSHGSFIKNYLFYSLIITHEHLYSTDKKLLHRPYTALDRLGIENIGFKNTLENRTHKIYNECIHGWHKFHSQLLTQTTIWSLSNL